MRQFSAACAQSVGQVREHNEDSLYMLTTQTTNNGDNTPLGLYIVADGMGGHQHGELASGLAVRSIANSILRKIFIPLTSIKPTPPSAPLQEILEDSVIEAHKVITREAPGSGTTLTVALLVDRTMLTAHVGDSRAYWIPDQGDVQVLTRDHSFVMRMLELGQITEAEAAVHPQRNVLYKALGQGEPSAPDISSAALPENGLLLLCSDGLWGVIPQNNILEILSETPDLQLAAQKLVDRANELGGPDNITAVLIRLPSDV
jgi:protein phosphatase